ncbi:MAG: hypothetical protein WC717_03150 [Candidatus Micrarchaeia archaeon]|jgi:hypothetical protein
MKLPSVFLLLAACALLLPGIPSAAYTENLTVQVFDYTLRPVEGAQAYVEYELSSVRGNVKTKPKLTDSTGHTIILFTNYEEIPNETSYAYTLFVKYGDQLVTASLIAAGGENKTYNKRTYTMMVESHIAFVRVLDQKGKPLVANVTADGKTKQTGEFGSTFFALPPGNYTIKVERNDLVKNVPLVIGNSTGDRSIDVVLSYYPLNVHVQDDMRRPLPAQVDVNGVGRAADGDGWARFENITTESPQVIVTYGQGIKRLQPNLQSSTSLEVTFDLGSPAIKEQYSSLSDSGVGTIRFFVEDAGPEASGIDTVSVSYEIGGVQDTISVYTISYNSFEAKIPAQPAGTLVKYTITVHDREGNSAVGSGNYVVPRAGSAPSANTSSPPPAMPEFSFIPNEGIFVGIVVLTVLAYAAIYYYNKRKAGGEMQPPPAAPPQAIQQ